MLRQNLWHSQPSMSLHSSPQLDYMQKFGFISFHLIFYTQESPRSTMGRRN